MNNSFRYKKSVLLRTLFFINNITSIFAQWEKGKRILFEKNYGGSLSSGVFFCILITNNKLKLENDIAEVKTSDI